MNSVKITILHKLMPILRVLYFVFCVTSAPGCYKSDPYPKAATAQHEIKLLESIALKLDALGIDLSNIRSAKELLELAADQGCISRRAGEIDELESDPWGNEYIVRGSQSEAQLEIDCVMRPHLPTSVGQGLYLKVPLMHLETIRK
jgi:hypothetical protein